MAKFNLLIVVAISLLIGCKRHIPVQLSMGGQVVDTKGNKVSMYTTACFEITYKTSSTIKVEKTCSYGFDVAEGEYQSVLNRDLTINLGDNPEALKVRAYLYQRDAGKKLYGVLEDEAAILKDLNNFNTDKVFTSDYVVNFKIAPMSYIRKSVTDVINLAKSSSNSTKDVMLAGYLTRNMACLTPLEAEAIASNFYSSSSKSNNLSMFSQRTSVRTDCLNSELR